MTAENLDEGGACLSIWLPLADPQATSVDPPSA